jgi:hypothetical protein
MLSIRLGPPVSTFPNYLQVRQRAHMCRSNLRPPVNIATLIRQNFPLTADNLSLNSIHCALIRAFEASNAQLDLNKTLNTLGSNRLCDGYPRWSRLSTVPVFEMAASGGRLIKAIDVVGHGFGLGLNKFESWFINGI